MPSQNHFDAIALLKADHRKVEDLFDEFEAAKGAARKQALVEKICAELSAHTVIEEEIFYPACRGKVEEGLLNEGYVEHDGSKVLIAELLASAPSAEFYDAKVKVLSEQIEHHVHEEERRLDGIFAQARVAGLDMERHTGAGNAHIYRPRARTRRAGRRKRGACLSAHPGTAANRSLKNAQRPIAQFGDRPLLSEF